MTLLILLKLRQWATDLLRVAMEHKLTVLALILVILAFVAGRCGRSEPPTPSINIESIERETERIEDRERNRLANTVNSIDNRIKQADNKVKQAGNKNNINAGDLENKLK